MAPEDEALSQEAATPPDETPVAAAVEPATETEMEAQAPPSTPAGPALAKWEIASYAVLFLVAAGLRFWDLGLRPIHYDEAIHGMYSLRLFRGEGFLHDPLLHGPFKIFGAAFFYVLFGVSDYAGRILPALFGSLIVAIPILYRRYLGRWGSLAAALMFTFSPAFLYYSRFDRDDIYIVAWELVLAWCMWRYIEQPRRLYLYLASAALALSFAAMETTFLSIVMFSGFLLLLSARSLWRAMRHRFNFAMLSPPGAFLLLLVTLSLPQWGAAVAWLQGRLGVVLANTDNAQGPDGIPLGIGVRVAVGIVIFLFLLSAAVGLRWSWRRWLVCAGIFYGIYVVFFTTYFTNWLGFASGMWRSFAYWFIVQQPKHRMDQPWFYYLMNLSVYEFLPLILATIGGIYYLIRRNLFTSFLIYWAVLALGLYSYAGEKAPWLVLHVVLPLILLAARLVGEVMASKAVLPRALLALSFVLLLSATGYRAVQSTFQRSDEPALMLVYAQVSFDVPPILEKIEEYAEQNGQGKDISIVIDADLAWPLMWYFQDYKQVSYPKINADALLANPDVVLVTSAHNGEVVPYVDRYGPGESFTVLTWFPEDYRSFKPSSVLSAAPWRAWWDYAVYRQTSPMWTSAAVAYFAEVNAEGTQ